MSTPPNQAGKLQSTRIGSQLEIQVEASNLANMDVFSLSDPFALLEEWKDEQWVEIGKFFVQSAFRNWIEDMYCPPCFLAKTMLTKIEIL